MFRLSRVSAGLELAPPSGSEMATMRRGYNQGLASRLLLRDRSATERPQPR